MTPTAPATVAISSLDVLSPPVTRVLAVVAHPDDESFGLGAVLEGLAAAGTGAAVLCFTHGEASTLGADAGDLATIRSAELVEAAGVLGLKRVELLDYPDGALGEVPFDELVRHVLRLIGEEDPSHLLVFDRGGITGHPDHVQATEAALAAARLVDLPVLAWVLPQAAADALNAEFAAGFVGRDAEELCGCRVPVSRERQWRAIACHRSQSTDNPVLRRRLDLLGDVEHVCLLRPQRHPAPRWAAPCEDA